MRRTTESHFICCNLSKSKSALVILIHNAKDWKKNICDSALRIIWALRCLFTCCVFPENWNRNLPVLKLLFLSRLLLEPGAQAVPLRQLRKVLRFLPEFDEPRSSARRKDHVSGMWKKVYLGERIYFENQYKEFSLECVFYLYHNAIYLRSNHRWKLSSSWCQLTSDSWEICAIGNTRSPSGFKLLGSTLCTVLMCRL